MVFGYFCWNLFDILRYTPTLSTLRSWWGSLKITWIHGIIFSGRPSSLNGRISGDFSLLQSSCCGSSKTARSCDYPGSIAPLHFNWKPSKNLKTRYRWSPKIHLRTMLYPGLLQSKLLFQTAALMIADLQMQKTKVRILLCLAIMSLLLLEHPITCSRQTSNRLDPQVGQTILVWDTSTRSCQQIDTWNSADKGTGPCWF